MNTYLRYIVLLFSSTFLPQSWHRPPPEFSLDNGLKVIVRKTTAHRCGQPAVVQSGLQLQLGSTGLARLRTYDV